MYSMLWSTGMAKKTQNTALLLHPNTLWRVKGRHVHNSVYSFITRLVISEFAETFPRLHYKTLNYDRYCKIIFTKCKFLQVTQITHKKKNLIVNITINLLIIIP